MSQLVLGPNPIRQNRLESWKMLFLMHDACYICGQRGCQYYQEIFIAA